MIEDYLLGLVAREEHKTLKQVRDEEELFPDDPPWNSECLVGLILEIEEYYGLDFDPLDAERNSRTLKKMSAYILNQLRVAASEAM